MRSKRCSKCGETKTLAEFHRNRSKCEGLQSQCKECAIAYQCAYREAHWEERNANQRAYYEAHREERLAYNRAYYEARREEKRAKDRAYREAHREELRAYRDARREEIRARDRAYREAHREECDAQNRKQKTEALKASREVATRNGEPWTAVEDQVLLTAGGTVLDIAIELGRTTSSVHSRRALLRRKSVTA